MYVSSMYAYYLHSLANLQSSALDSLETSRQPIDPRPIHLLLPPPPCFKISGSASDFILHPPLYIREFFHCWNCWNARIKGYGSTGGRHTFFSDPPPNKKKSHPKTLTCAVGMKRLFFILIEILIFFLLLIYYIPNWDIEFIPSTLSYQI